MSIYFEEITGDVVPEPRREESRADGREAEIPELALAERIRAVLAREHHRRERLSDR